MKPSLETVSTYSTQHGLDPSDLERVLRVITQPSSLDQTSRNALLKCLYPSQVVSNEAVYIVVDSLGHGALKATMATQQGLIRWLVNVCNYLKDHTILSKSYSVLFNLLDSFNLRAELCCLLAKLTRKKHVKAFRVQMLRDLCAKVSTEPSLLKLMAVYEKVCPGRLDFGKLTKGAGKFSDADSDWIENLEQIQGKARLQSVDEDTRGILNHQPNGPAKCLAATSGSYTSLRLGSIDDFIEGLDQPATTEPKGLALQDEIFQTRFALEEEGVFGSQVDELLSRILPQQPDEISQGQKKSHKSSDVLERSLAFTKYTKVGWSP